MISKNVNTRSLFLLAFLAFLAGFPTKAMPSAWLENDDSLKVVLGHAKADNIYSLLENPSQLGQAKQHFNSLFLEYGLTDYLALTLKYLDKETQFNSNTYSNSQSQIGLKFDVSFLNPGLIPPAFIEPIGRDKVGSISLHKTATSFRPKNNSTTYNETANSYYLELADKFMYTDFNIIQSIGYGQDLFSGTTWSRQHVFLTIELDKFDFGVRTDFFEDSFSGYREINRRYYISLGDFYDFSITLLSGPTSWKGLKTKANTIEIQLQYRFE